MKRFISLLLVALLIINILVPISFAEDNPRDFLNYNSRTGAFEGLAHVPLAAPNVTIRHGVVGSKATAKINGKTYIVYQPLTGVDSTPAPNPSDPSGRLWVFVSYEIPRDTLYNNFRSQYTTAEERRDIDDFFAGGGSEPMIIDILTTKIVNGVRKGKLNGVSKNLDNVREGDVAENFAEFEQLVAPVTWSSNTKKAVQQDYYNRKIRFEPKLYTKPVAVISHSETKAVSNTHTFKLGELIAIDGTESIFKNVGSVKRTHEWYYKKSTDVVYPTNPIINNGESPFNGKQEVGTYDVRLRVSETVTKWDNTPQTLYSDYTQTRIIIEPNPEPLALATITAPKEIQLAPMQNTVDINVNLSSVVQNIEIEDILMVELEISTTDGLTTRRNYYQPSLAQNFSTTINVPYYGIPRVQAFKGISRVTLKGGGVVESPVVYTSTYLYKTQTNIPPVPILNMPDSSMIGNVFISGASSYDIDGWIVNYDFSIPSIGFYQDGASPMCSPNFLSTGTYQVILGVTDNDGARSETGKSITITPVPPSINLSSRGYYKENRKITLIATNWTELQSPIGNNYTWTIKPMDLSNPQSKVKMISTTGKEIDVLMKKKGKYLVTATGTNSFGISDTKTMILDVREDAPPIPDIRASSPQYRNEDKKATVTAFDSSFSPDGDFVGTRTWSYRFDSNNDGSFVGEQSIHLKTTNDYMDNGVKFEVTSVGNYEITMTVKEAFGQETIPTFITDADYKTATTSKVITIDNFKPTVSFFAVPEKKIDIDIITDYEGQALLDFESKLNLFKQEAQDNYLNVNFNVISDKKYLGRYIPEGAKGFLLVDDENSPKYAVANWNGLIEYSDHTYTVSYKTIGIFPTDQTHVTNGTFPSRVKQSISYNNGKANVFLLENGNMYFLGTNSGTQGGDMWGHINHFATSPILVATGIEEIQLSKMDISTGAESGSIWVNNSEIVFARKTNGEIYATGRELSRPLSSMYTSAEPNNLLIPVTTMGDRRPLENLMVGGFKEISKVNGFSNVEYMYVTDRAIITRNKNGDWHGIGARLSRFGYPTKMQDDVYRTSHKRNDYNNDHDYYHYTNNVVKLDHLTNLDKAIGGIEKIEANKAYGKNGKVYSFKLNQSVISGIHLIPNIPIGITYDQTAIWNNRAWVPLQYLSSPTFTYDEIGTWNKNEKPEAESFYFQQTWNYPPANTYQTSQAAIQKALSEGIASEGEWFEGGYNVSIPEGQIREGYTVPKTTLRSGIIIDFEKLQAYMGRYRGTYYKSRSERDEGEYYNIYWFRGTLVGVAPVATIKNKQVGWKIYGVDAEKLTTSTYRPNSEKYLICVLENDSFKKAPKTLENHVKSQNMKVRVSAKQSYIDDNSINNDTETNLRGLINATPNGKAYAENSIDQILNEILTENGIKNAPDGGVYIILGEEEVKAYQTLYRDLENDPKLSEQSRAIHNKDHFENSQGYSVYHNQIRPVPIRIFDKVGKYEIQYMATDKPSNNIRFASFNKTSDPATLNVYVHRRPIANFDLDYDYRVSNIGISMNDLSYDLDHQSKANKGIAKKEWAYRVNDEVTWRTGTPTSLNYKDKVEIYLEVTDLEGATASTTRTFTMVDEMPFIIKSILMPMEEYFEIEKIPASEWLKLTNIEVNQESPHRIEVFIKSTDGKISNKYIQIGNSEASLYSNIGGKRLWRDILIRIPETYKDGEYEIEIKAIKVNNEEAFSRNSFSVFTPVRIIGDIKEENDGSHKITGTTGTYSTNTYVKLFYGTAFEAESTLSFSNISDNSGNALNFGSLSPLDLNKIWIQTGNLVYDLKNGSPNAGKYNAQFRTQTASGKIATYICEYEYNPIRIEAFDVFGYWNYWRGQINIKGEAMTNEPHRFLSLEKVVFEAIIKGEVDYAVLRLSPELEAMTFKDIYGNIYRYEDDFGKKVYFPVQMTRNIHSDKWKFEYSLPYAASTKSLDNKRLRSSYRAILYVYPKGNENPVISTIEDIEITGNIFDNIYFQPIVGDGKSK